MRLPAALALLALTALAGADPALAAKGDVTPLFAADTPIAIGIAGPVRGIASRAERSTEPAPATLTVNGETHAIMLSARGISRRARTSCEFPPLLVKFNEKPAETSLFAKQGRIKLVTHCRNTNGFEPYVLREYAVYRLYNILTPESLKVRLARVRYEDAGKLVTERWGFFIEDVDDAAKRMGGEELSVETVPNSALIPSDAARYAIFQYMIGNLDWDMGAGPKGTDCCHNSKLIGANAAARTALIPVPYDFDYAGMVNPPYALPPEGIPVPNVRVRYYRGLCRHNAEALSAASDFLAARPAMEADIRAITQLPARDRDNMLSYLADFFDDIATPDQVTRKLLKTCR